MSSPTPRRSAGATVRAVTLAVWLVAGPGLLAPSLAPAATAATCSGSGGVSVVVDYRELGGGIVTGCAPGGGGRSAASIFESAGVALSYATRQPGFVCRVNGAPTSDPCVNTSPADAYWGLWWSEGSSASWTYSSQSVGGLTVPDGGSVAWSWQQGRTDGAVPPGVGAPVTEKSTPSPTASPSPSRSPSRSPSPTPVPTPSPTPSSTPARTPSPSPSTQPPVPSDSPSATPQPSSDATPSASPGPAKVRPSKARSPRGGKREDRPEPAPGDEQDSQQDPGSDSTDPLAGVGSEVPPTEAAEDEPTRVPTWASWGVLGLLGAAAAGSAVLARRRRGV